MDSKRMWRSVVVVGLFWLSLWAGRQYRLFVYGGDAVFSPREPAVASSVDEGQTSSPPNPFVRLKTQSFLECDRLLRAGDYLSLESALRELALRDPQLAIEWCNRLPARQRAAGLVPVLSTWFESQPSRVFEWAKTNCPSFFESGEFVAACASKGDLKLATEGLATVQNNVVRSNLLTQLGVLRSDTAEQRDKLMLYAASLKSGQSYPIYLGMIETWAGSEPETAMEWAVQNARSSAERSGFVQSAIKGWVAVKGASEAAAFLDSIPVSKEFYGAYREIAKAYASESPDKVMGWLQAKFSEKTFLDGAAVGAAVELMNSRPDIACRLLSMAARPELLERRLARVLPLWSAKDPLAAESFVTGSSKLDEEQRSRLLQLIRR